MTAMRGVKVITIENMDSRHDTPVNLGFESVSNQREEKMCGDNKHGFICMVGVGIYVIIKSAAGNGNEEL